MKHVHVHIHICPLLGWRFISKVYSVFFGASINSETNLNLMSALVLSSQEP